MTAARWAGSCVSDNDLRNRRAATDRAAAEFRGSAATGPAGAEEADGHLVEVENGLDDLDAYREHADADRKSGQHAHRQGTNR